MLGVVVEGECCLFFTFENTIAARTTSCALCCSKVSTVAKSCVHVGTSSVLRPGRGARCMSKRGYDARANGTAAEGQCERMGAWYAITMTAA